jgi:hypothetical protein
MTETVCRPKVPKGQLHQMWGVEPAFQYFTREPGLRQIASVTADGSWDATDLTFMRCAVMRAPPPTLHPMTDFDPSEPAILHDLISDTIIAWSGEEAAAFRRSAVRRPDGTLAWDGYEFDGWGNVLGG